jgi:hypothetical protein
VKALIEELRRKLEVCHHRFLRKMVGITIYNVKDIHISNEQVREELNRIPVIRNFVVFYAC